MNQVGVEIRRSSREGFDDSGFRDYANRDTRSGWRSSKLTGNQPPIIRPATCFIDHTVRSDVSTLIVWPAAQSVRLGLATQVVSAGMVRRIEMSEDQNLHAAGEG